MASAKLRNSWRKKTGIENLKIVIAKLLERNTFIARDRRSYSNYTNEEETDDLCVPEDVKEGHFAVIAIARDGLPKRYVVALSFLANPAFQKLLEAAAEEYGFDREGTLTIPCRRNELESILAHDRKTDKDAFINANNESFCWASCSQPVKSC